MGYYSQVNLKTTTEGYLTLKRLDDSVTNEEDKPFYNAEIEKTETGFYKIIFDSIKWSERYKDITNFIQGLDLLEESDIPYSFIRLGEDVSDIEHRTNITSDTPDEIVYFEPTVDINDTSFYCEKIK